MTESRYPRFSFLEFCRIRACELGWTIERGDLEILMINTMFPEGVPDPALNVFLERILRTLDMNPAESSYNFDFSNVEFPGGGRIIAPRTNPDDALSASDPLVITEGKPEVLLEIDFSQDLLAIARRFFNPLDEKIKKLAGMDSAPVVATRPVKVIQVNPYDRPDIVYQTIQSRGWRAAGVWSLVSYMMSVVGQDETDQLGYVVSLLSVVESGGNLFAAALSLGNQSALTFVDLSKVKEPVSFLVVVGESTIIKSSQGYNMPNAPRLPA